MQEESSPYSRALVEVRARLADGRIRPGASLAAASLATELRLSQTPLREVFARLAGEGLIEERRGRGYFAWPLGAADITDLYQVEHGLLSTAIELMTHPDMNGGHLRDDVSIPSTPGSGEDPTPIFDHLVLATGNRPLWEAWRRTTDRLALVRTVEQLLYEARASSAEALHQAVNNADMAALRLAIAVHHTDRLRTVSAVAGAIQRRFHR